MYPYRHNPVREHEKPADRRGFQHGNIGCETCASYRAGQKPLFGVVER